MKSIQRWRMLGAMLIGLSLLLVLCPAPVWGEALRAGLAKIDITPALPVTLAGYGSRKDLSKGVHDPLFARAVAFEQGGQRLVVVSTDVLGFYGGTADLVRQAILEASGLKPSELFLCAIHTHSAPTVVLDPARGHTNNVAYSQELRGKLVEVVRAALAGLGPVQIGAGAGASPVGCNRREVAPDSAGKPRTILGRNPSIPIDREVQVLKLARPGQTEPAGALFAFATHSTSLGPRNYIVSSDVHGLAEQFLEKYYGGGMIAAAFAGASGNIDPWYRVLPGFDTANGWVPETVLLGTLLGEEVAHVFGGITNLTAGGPIKTRFQTLDLPGKPRGESAPATASQTTPFNITVGRIGDIAFVGLGGEVFNELGRAIKDGSPFRRTFIFTHCNGAAGYVPIRSAYPDGGYEVQSTAFAPGAGEQMAEHAIQMLKELQGAQE